MSSSNIPYYVVLDANIWVTERLLQSSIGTAVLFALTSSGALLGLPKVVETEVNRVLTVEAERAVEALRKNARLLRQLSGQKTLHQVPSAEGIQEGLKNRWSELSGLLERVPFTFQQAKSALRRVIEKTPPSGENNEQFRDCCLWEAAFELSKNRPVYFLTNDSAFYEARNRAQGLTGPLREEITAAHRDLHVYASIREFLSGLDKTVAALDESAIAKNIVDAVTPDAIRMTAERAELFELVGVSSARISGYATPKPSVVAISFEIRFKLRRIEPVGDTEDRNSGNLRVEGVCSYDPKRTQVSEIEIRGWSVFAGGIGGWSGSHMNIKDMERKTRYIESI